jgi:hypothetical protein
MKFINHDGELKVLGTHIAMRLAIEKSSKPRPKQSWRNLPARVIRSAALKRRAMFQSSSPEIVHENQQRRTI